MFLELLASAADAPAQLVQLRKSKAVRLFDDHASCVGNVNANFNDSRRRKNLNLVLAEVVQYF